MKTIVNTFLCAPIVAMNVLLNSAAFGVVGVPVPSTLEPGDFGGGTVVEGFEGFGNVDPWGLLPFDFGSGVQLTDGAQGDSTGVVIRDGAGFFGWGTAADIPQGTQFVGHGNPGLFATTEFTFDTPMLRVGGFVTLSNLLNGTPLLIMEAFDATGALLDSRSIEPVATNLWRDNFLGVESSVGIKSVTLVTATGGGAFMLDQLHFQAVPEPSSLILVLTSVLVMQLRPKR